MNQPIKKTPIKNQIGGVFVPVRDLAKARQWYNNILGLENGEIYFGHIYTAPMKGSASLLLDTMPKWRKEDKDIPTYQAPFIQFITNDIDASYQFMIENQVELVTDIEDDFYFVIKDLDGNLLMICKEQA